MTSKYTLNICLFTVWSLQTNFSSETQTILGRHERKIISCQCEIRDQFQINNNLFFKRFGMNLYWDLTKISDLFSLKKRASPNCCSCWVEYDLSFHSQPGALRYLQSSEITKSAVLLLFKPHEQWFNNKTIVLRFLHDHNNWQKPCSIAESFTQS